MKRVVKIKRLKRKRKHGFRKRMRTHAGELVVKRRRQKGRKKTTA